MTSAMPFPIEEFSLSNRWTAVPTGFTAGGGGLPFSSNNCSSWVSAVGNKIKKNEELQTDLTIPHLHSAIYSSIRRKYILDLVSRFQQLTIK
jgi:hypothetical protein